MVKLRVLGAEKLNVQDQNETILQVEIQLFEPPEQPDTEESILENRKLGFPLGISKEELTAELLKFLETYNSDLEQKAANAARDEMSANADKVIEEVKGMEL